MITRVYLIEAGGGDESGSWTAPIIVLSNEKQARDVIEYIELYQQEIERICSLPFSKRLKAAKISFASEFFTIQEDYCDSTSDQQRIHYQINSMLGLGFTYVPSSIDPEKLAKLILHQAELNEFYSFKLELAEILT